MPAKIFFRQHGRGGGVSRTSVVVVWSDSPAGGKLVNRDDGATVTAAARDGLSGVEGQLEVSVRTCLKRCHVRQVDLRKRFCIVAVLGFARRWLNRDSAARRYLTDAVFPYYIAHQTAIILIAHELKGLDSPTWVEATLVIGGTLLSCVATYEIVRRVRVLRPLFGLRLDLPGDGAQPGRSEGRRAVNGVQQNRPLPAET
jgi:hypothetical protein